MNCNRIRVHDKAPMKPDVLPLAHQMICRLSVYPGIFLAKSTHETTLTGVSMPLWWSQTLR